MNAIIHLENISDLNRILRQESPRHPLVSVIDFTKVEDHFEHGTKISSNFYSIMFKNYCLNKLRYGREYYDFQEGSLMCIAPKQVVMLDNEIDRKDNMMGWGLFFHPDLIKGTSLGNKIRDYSFFSYEMSEALHLSEKEKQILYDCVLKIQTELSENLDNHSQTLIVSNIELLLNYCSRYYDRQFITRKSANKNILAKCENVLVAYFSSEELKNKGLPTVKHLAEQMHLSPNYLSDLLKKETGMNAQDHIHYFIIEEAKHILLSSDTSISEIAYQLGFEYPHYFSKLFKLKTGMTPVEYRSLN